jgi:hypothetical protein
LKFTPGSGSQKAHDCRSKKPLIIVFGWLGAKRKNIEKYSKLYVNQGFDTLDYLTPATVTWFPKQIPKLTQRISNEIIEHYQKLTEKNNTDNRKIVFHTLSLNGFFTYLMLLRHLQTNEGESSSKFLLSSINGCIIDSAPAYLTPELAAKGFVGLISSRLSKKVD